MGQHPPRPLIYHITHGRNLARIIADGCLWSDEAVLAQGGPEASIGLSDVKRRRLEILGVDCHPGTRVGQYVPFYFCPRSVMLYLLHMGNHPALTYKEGQRPILHLEADLQEVVAWADSLARPWAFTDRNAGSFYFKPFCDLSQLNQLAWDHIADLDFRDPLVKEAKQAEFLLFGSFPWTLVQTIGVLDEPIANRVREILTEADHSPDVQVRTEWYY